MLCSKSTVQATGLNIWYSGEPEGHHEPEVDIIAVQGLDAHPYYTWVGKQDSAEGGRAHRRPIDFLRGRPKDAQAPEATETMWLRDLLPTLIPHARIATYSYEIDRQSAAVKTSLRKCGEQLLNVLHQNRSGEKVGLRQEFRRPLVFVGHSLGGLIIKQALVLASHGNDFSNIRLSTAGIVFLGTPFQGSNVAVYGRWLAQAVGHDKTLLESFNKNSPAFYEIEREFETCYRDADTVYFESIEASIGPWQIQLVDQQSAILRDRRIIYLTTDHSGLNKFYGPEDENFRLVRPEIQRMVQTAASKIEARHHHPVTNKEDFRVTFSLQGIPVVSRFVARDAEMNQLIKELLPASTNEVRRKVSVLVGRGGIGKTQLAVEYARKYQTSYSAIFWIDGSTKERLGQNVANLANRLPQDQASKRAKSYLQEEGSKIDEVVNDVLEWLSQPWNNQWLLIFDNVDRGFNSASSEDPQAYDVRRYFPEADHGSILITSRLTNLSQLGTVIEVEPVSELQGESILKNSFGKSVKGSPKLVRLLQGLPLAINQAGSYMRETGITVAEYMKLYDYAWRNLKTSQTDADRSVLTTWSLSFDHLRAQSEEAANLLLLWAFLDNQDLWYGLLAPALNQGIVDKMPDWFAICAGNELDFKECMSLLLKYSFVAAKIESSSFSIHPIFHHWCFHAFEEERAVMNRLAVIVVASAVPSKTTPHYSLIQRRLLPHCDRIFSLAQQGMQETFVDEMNFEWQSDAYHKLGALYSDQGRMKEAEEMYLQALAGKEKTWGGEHTSTLTTVNNLANLYKSRGRAEEAEEMYLQALAGKEKAWGFEHPSTLNTVNNLGVLYRDQGKMVAAEEMYLRALEGYEKAWGAEHTSTLDTVNNLANLYLDQGKMVEAEEMYLQALIGYEKAWGAEHPSTLDTVSNLGQVYSDQGKMREAEDMYLRALTGKEKAWGAEHTSTLDTVNNLGVLYSVQGKTMEAEEMYLRALIGYENAWGAEHSSTLDTLSNLGHVYSDQGKMIEAEEMYLRALAGKEKAWGAEHTSTLNTVHNLGVLYSVQGKTMEAEEMYLRALIGYEKARGDKHTSTLNTVNNLGVLYMNQGKMVAAEEMYLRALKGYETSWGPEHPSTLNAVSNLANLYSNQGKLTEAEEMFQQALHRYEKALGFDHLSTLDTANKLGNLYIQLSKLKPAELYLRRAVIGYTRSLGVEHSSTKDASRNLAYVRTLRRTSEENVDTSSDSDASSVDSYIGGASQAPSSVTSVSLMPQAEREKFITGLAQLLLKADGIRDIIWKALERSRDELKFDQSKIVRNFNRLLRRYAEELNQNSRTSMQKISAKFVRKNSYRIATAVFQPVQSAETLQHRTGVIEKVMLDRFVKDVQAQDVSEMTKPENSLQNRQTMKEGKGEEESASSDGSEASSVNEVLIDHSIEMVAAFMVSGMPFTNLKHRFQDFVERNMSHDDATRDPQQRDFSSNLSYAEDGRVQIRWQCKCGRQFQENIIEHKAGAAEEFVRHMHWDAPPDIQSFPYQWPLLNALMGFLRVLLRRDGPGARSHESWWGGPLQISRQNPRHEVHRQRLTAHGNDVAATNPDVPEWSSHFVCICIRHISRAKYLHHVEVKDCTDQYMFKEIQRRYNSVRPWWKRLLFCARLTSVQYYEFKLFYSPEDQVIIEENWKDRFPENHPEGEWHYIPSTRDSTPYLHGDVLFHYVQYPTHAKPGDYLWKRIPKKVREKLSCGDDPERTGWGLVMEEEWHQTAFLICWVPVVVIGGLGSGLYCFYAEKPATFGFTAFGGILALVVWFYQLAQSYAKQGGLL